MKISEVKKLISSKNYLKRIEGYSWLGDFSKSVARKYLINGMKDSHHQVRANIADFMGQAKDYFYVPYLLEFLEDKSHIVRFRAVESLGYYRKKKDEIEDFLIKALSDGSSTVRVCTAESLRNIFSEKALPYLKKIVESDPNKVARAMAIDAIGYIKQMSKSRNYVKWMESRLEVEIPDLKPDLYSALIEMGSFKYFNDLVACLGSRSYKMRKRVINMLKSIVADYIGYEKVLEVLQEHKKREKHLLCLEVLDKGVEHLCEKIGEVQNISEELIGSRIYSKRIEGYSRLCKYSRLIEREYFLNGMKDRHCQVRASIVNFMEQSKDSFYIPYLLEGLKDRSAVVRWSVIDSLACFRRKGIKIEKALLNVLKDNNSIVRMAAADFLGDICSQKSLPYLKKMAKSDPDKDVREVAKDCIEQITDDR